MKLNYIIHSTTLAISIAASTASAAVILGPVVNPSNGHSYYLLDDTTWQSGESSSVSLGGHLATINNLAEQSWVFGTFGTVGGTDRSLWIGFYEQGAEGNYVWVSGEPVTYTNWGVSPTEPSNAGGTEAFVHLERTGNGFGNTPGIWNDINSPNTSFPEFNPFAAVAEVVPEPSTALLLISGIAFCLRRRTFRTNERSA